MHPRLVELSDHLDRHRAELRAAVASVPPDRHALSPEEGAWSVLGVLEHLTMVESRVGPALQRQINEARAAGVAPETATTPIMPTLDIAQYVDRTTKIKASEAAQPKSGKSLEELWRALDAARETTRGAMAAGDGMSLGDVTMAHPVFGPMHLYRWFAWVGSHEARHAAQIREIGASLASR
jgi:uncharacterized damage-inducible protein DinB